MKQREKTSILIRGRDYRYPSKSERKLASSEFPRFKNFGFERKTALFSVLDGFEIDPALMKDNIYFWDKCLANRLGLLYKAFYNTVAYFNRGVSDEFNNITEKEALNLMMFHFYSETYYYFLFTVKDNLYQILNLYYECKRDERDYQIKKFVDKRIEQGCERDKMLFEAIKRFDQKLKQSIEIRNSFAHRFPPNFPDYRAKRDSEELNVIHAGSGNHFKSREIIDDIKESIEQLYILIEQIRRRIGY